MLKKLRLQRTVWVNNECVSDTVILAKSLRTKTEPVTAVVDAMVHVQYVALKLIQTIGTYTVTSSPTLKG